MTTPDDADLLGMLRAAFPNARRDLLVCYVRDSASLGRMKMEHMRSILAWAKRRFGGDVERPKGDALMLAKNVLLTNARRQVEAGQANAATEIETVAAYLEALARERV